MEQWLKLKILDCYDVLYSLYNSLLITSMHNTVHPLHTIVQSTYMHSRFGIRAEVPAQLAQFDKSG